MWLRSLNAKLSTAQQWILFGCGYLIACVAIIYYLLYGRFMQYRHLAIHHNQVQHQWQQAHVLIQQKSAPLLASNDFNQSLTYLASASQMVIDTIQPLGENQWQTEGTANYQHFDHFLQTLGQQPFMWALSTMQLHRQTGDRLQWQLTWQYTPPPLPQHSCQSLPRTSVAHVFQAHTDLSDAMLKTIPISHLQWLGVMQQANHSAALIRFADFPPRLIEVGDVVGVEQWRLIALDPHHAEWLDGKHQHHSLVLDNLSHG